MKNIEFITEFHNRLWLQNDYEPYMDIQSIYYSEYNSRNKSGPKYEISEYCAVNIPEELGVYKKHGDNTSIIQNINYEYNRFKFEKFANKYFKIDDYNFYSYYRNFETEKDNTIHNITEISFYIDYHGYRNKVLTIYKQVNNSNTVVTKFKGYYYLLNFLQNHSEDLNLEDYDFKSIFGDWKETDIIRWYSSISPKMLTKYRYEKGDYTWCEYQNTSDYNYINFDHFILLETENGVYKPSKDMYTKLRSFNNQVKPSKKKLSNLGIHTIQFRNNTAFDITDYYNLTGVKIKCSESVLKMHEALRKYHENQDLAKDVTIKEKKAEKQREAEIAEAERNDTYSLVQFGVTILKMFRHMILNNILKIKQMLILINKQ